MRFNRSRSVKLTALTQLKKAFQFSLSAHEKNIKDVQSFAEEQDNNLISRRRFVGNMAKAGAVVGAAGLYQACNGLNKNTQPSIAIVGAGIAGLHAAYILTQAGYAPQVYEASGRIGGRIFSEQGAMGRGLWTEMGGEFIDTGHSDMLSLAKHFNLPLLDRKAPSEKSLKEYSYYFNKTRYQLKDVLEALQPVSQQIKKDIASLSANITYNNHTPADAALDNLTVMQYIEKLGVTGWFKSFIYNSYTAEYGMDANEQSALNFLTLISPDEKGQFTPYGNSDERFSVIGGNEKICQALGGAIKQQLHKGYALVAIKQNSSKQYVLGFNKDGGATEDVVADIVILTLPFTVLRGVDIKLPLPAWKTNSIKNVGYGSNSKIFVGVNERVWRRQGYAGYTFTDNGLMNGYDSTQMQNNNQGAGVFTIAPGGKAGVDAGKDYNLMKQQSVAQLEEIYPGAGAQFNGRLQYWNWPGYPFSKCSYMSYKAGQYTTMQGTQFQPVDNLYFAGEHCSISSQGFMNGAAETGRMAAEMIIKKLKGK
jgi:monoamine oxidase